MSVVPAGYKQTEVGVIPEDWRITNLESSSAFITKGSTPTTYGFKWESSGVLFLRSECVSADGLDLTQSMFISTAAHSTLRRSEVVDGDILVTITGNVGRVVRLSGVVEANLNQHIARVRITADDADGQYVYHFLSQPETRRRFNSITTGQAYPQISLKQVREAAMPLPPLEEQRAIAAALSDVDALLAKLDQFIAKKRDLKQAAMQQLLTGQTRLPGFGGEWGVKRLHEIAIANWGNTSITKAAYRDSGFQAYSASGPDGFVDWYEHDQPSVVLSAIGAQCGKTWRTSEKWTPIKNTIWFRAIEGEADTTFLYWYTSDPSFWPNRGQAQPFIALGDVRGATISVPLLAEQTAIAAVLSDMDAELAALEARRDKTLALKQGMMRELLTGRIRLV